MKRAKELRRKSRLKPTRLRPKKRSPKERADKFAKEYGSVERVMFVRDLRCIVRHGCDGAIENAHTWNRGKGLKGPPESIVPLCTAHHRELHQHGVKTFEREHVLELREHAAGTESIWQRRHSRLTPLSAIVPGVVADLMGDAE